MEEMQAATSQKLAAHGEALALLEAGLATAVRFGSHSGALGIKKALRLNPVLRLHPRSVPGR